MLSAPAALYRPFWLGVWGSTALVSLGGWLSTPAMVLESLGFLFVQAFFAAIFWRLFWRFPAHITAAQMIFGMVSSLLFLLYTYRTWQNLGLEGLLQGTLTAPFAMGLAFAWGGAGMGLNLLALTIFVVLQTDKSTAAFFGMFIFLLQGMVGWALQMYFERIDRRYSELERSTNTDALTQIGNRRALLTDFVHFQNLAQKKSLPLLLTSWDVDGLKRINDRQGHQAGDAYIQGFVTALRNAVREGDGLYRTGGDEFVGLHLGLENGNKLYERVRLSFPNVSGGWSNAKTLTLDQALTEADVQMYAEKRAHKAVITSIIGDSQTR